MQSSQRVPSGSRVCHEYHEKVSSRPNFPGLSPPAATLPASLRKIKASEKVAIPDPYFLELLDKTKDLSYYCHHTYLLGQRCLLV